MQNESIDEWYLRLLSDVGKSKNESFKYIKDRVWAKVQGWMEKCLAAAGGKKF